MYSVVSTGMVAGDIRILIHCEGLIVGCPSPLWRKGVGERESAEDRMPDYCWRNGDERNTTLQVDARLELRTGLGFLR